jgi:exodeoxyribonuclease VII small subunit
MSKKIPKNIKFEAALSELEKQVELLESGQLSLDDSLAAFQYGTELSKICLGKLNTAKGAVEKLVVPAGNEEAYHTEPFATTSEAGAGKVKEPILRYDAEDADAADADEDDVDDSDDADNDDDVDDADDSDDAQVLGEVTAEEETED